MEGSEDFDDTDLIMRCLEPEERLPELPEIINQAWECSYKTEVFGYLFTPYG